jgi:uncharacterized protein (TIGR03437 family)
LRTVAGTPSGAPRNSPDTFGVKLGNPMLYLRLVFAAALCLSPGLAATFGTVVSNPVGQAGISDIVLDEARRRVYLVNSSASRIEVYGLTTNPPRQTNLISTDKTPLSAAMSRNGKYLYVACYDASTLFTIDLDRLARANSTQLAAKPEGVAVDFDEKVLISTIGTGQGQAVLIVYDPAADASSSLRAITVAPPAPSPPTLPPPSNRIYLSGRGRLNSSRDGRLIIGVNTLTNNTRTVFVYDAVTQIVARSRNVSNLSPTVSISPDGSKFMAGLVLFDTETLQVMAQQNASNSPFVFPGGGTNNFNLQQNQGGSIFSPDGQYLFSAFNIAPTQNPPARANSSRFLINDPDNLLIQLGIQLVENLVGKMVINSDGSVIYALSESGFMVINLGDMLRQPLAIPESPIIMLANDQCGVTASQRAATIAIRNAGGGSRMSASAQLLQVTNTGPVGLGGTSGAGGGGTGGAISILLPPQIVGAIGNIGVPATSGGFSTSSANNTTQSAPQVRVTSTGNGANLTVQFSSIAARSLGTVAPHDLLIQSSEAINIPPNVRVYQNNREAEAKGTIIPIPIGTSNSEGLVDMLVDNTRQRLYIANSGLNRIEVFDMRTNKLLSPIKVGQLPRSMAFGTDGVSLYVGNSGGESISIVDLDRGVVSGRVKFPPIPFNAAFSLITPSVLASSQRGPQIIMSDGTLWKIVGDTAIPRVLNTGIFGSARTITGPIRTMASTPEGRFVLLLAGNGNAYLYSSDADDYINVRTVISSPIQGYYGPIAAGPNGAYYLVNGVVLNEALTPIQSAPTFTIGPGGVTTGGGEGGVTPGIGGSGLPTRGNTSTTLSRPVSAVTAVGARTFARFSMPIRLNQNQAVTDAGQIELVEADTGRTLGVANALEGPLASGTATQRVNTNGRTMATDAAGTTAYVLTTTGLSIIPIDRTAASDRPQIAQNGVVNAASLQAGAAPNTLITILGRNLASTEKASTSPLPTVLGGVCVTLNNSPLPLLATSPEQINAQVPTPLTAGRYPVIVRSIAKKAASGSTSVSVAKYSPAVFMETAGPAIFHKDGRRVDRDAPGKRDELLYIYATGLGATKGGKVTAGAPSPSSPLAVTDKVQAYFGDPSYREAEVIVEWSGLVPGQIGVYQINVRIPGAHIKGKAVPVTLRIGGVSSPSTGSAAPTVPVD